MLMEGMPALPKDKIEESASWSFLSILFQLSTELFFSGFYSLATGSYCSWKSSVPMEMAHFFYSIKVIRGAMNRLIF